MTIAQTSTAAVPFAELDALTIGTVAVPGDKKYDALVSPWNVAVPVRPAAVLAAHDAQDVVDAVQFAARRGWSPASYDRLVRVRQAADPTGLFVAPQRSSDDR